MPFNCGRISSRRAGRILPQSSLSSHFLGVAFALALYGVAPAGTEPPKSLNRGEPRCITGNPFGGKTCLEGDGETLNATDANGKLVWRGKALPGPSFGPQCFTDTPSAIKVCIEDDGRHLTAMDGSGKILWRRDPFVDAKLALYRTNEAPTINVLRAGGIHPPPGHPGPRVWIMFASSQFGEVDITMGDFIPEGQN